MEYIFFGDWVPGLSCSQWLRKLRLLSSAGRTMWKLETGLPNPAPAFTSWVTVGRPVKFLGSASWSVKWRNEGLGDWFRSVLRTAKCRRHVDQDYRNNEIDWLSKFIIINSDINSLYCGRVLQASPLLCGSSWVSWHTTVSTRLGVWVIDIFFIYLSVYTFIDSF